MAKRLFNKEFFIRSVKYNVRTLFRKEIEEATEQQIFQAVGRCKGCDHGCMDRNAEGI